MKKDIKNYNYKGQHHGYQEWYGYFDGKLCFRGNWKNNLRIGYVEWTMEQTLFLIK
jgi:hypothetical protein